MTAAKNFIPKVDLVEECTRDLRVARQDLLNAGAKFGALTNSFRAKDHGLYMDAVCELEEAGREFAYREALLEMAIREEEAKKPAADRWPTTAAYLELCP